MPLSWKLRPQIADILSLKKALWMRPKNAWEWIFTFTPCNTLKFNGDSSRSQWPQILVNPEIIHCEADYHMREGCMSLLEYVVPVARSRRIVVRSQDERGQWHEHKTSKF